MQEEFGDIPKEQPEHVKQRRTDNPMTKRKKNQKDKTTIYKTDP